jgi:hypothetical protein
MELTTATALLIKPNFPFIQWIKSIHKGSEFEEDILSIVKEKSREEGHLYVVEEGIDTDAVDVFLEEAYSRFLEMELDLWQIDPELWPRDCTYAMFRKWFSVGVLEYVIRPTLSSLDDPKRTSV